MNEKASNPISKLDESDYQILLELESLKNKFFSVMNRKMLVEKLADIIDSVDGLNFNSKRDKKRINVNKPRYILNISDELLNMKKHNFDDMMYEKISKVYTNWLSEASVGNKDISDIFSKIREKYGDIISSHMINTTIAYHRNIKDKKLIVTYFI